MQNLNFSITVKCSIFNHHFNHQMVIELALLAPLWVIELALLATWGEAAHHPTTSFRPFSQSRKRSPR